MLTTYYDDTPLLPTLFFSHSFPSLPFPSILSPSFRNPRPANAACTGAEGGNKVPRYTFRQPQA